MLSFPFLVLLASLLASTDPVQARDAVVVFPDNSCLPEHQDIIRKEMGFVVDMATTTADNLQHGIYYKTFLAEELTSDLLFRQRTAERFRRISKMAEGSSSDELLVTCRFTSPICAQPRYNTLHMTRSPGPVQRLNICNGLFQSEARKDTDKLLTECSKNQIPLWLVSLSKSARILHELTHTDYVMWEPKIPGRWAVDFAYGVDDCLQLARGHLDRGKTHCAGRPVMCPDPHDKTKDGICPAKTSVWNADTYAMIASGVYFSIKCKREIPVAGPMSLRAQAAASQSSHAGGSCSELAPSTTLPAKRPGGDSAEPRPGLRTKPTELRLDTPKRKMLDSSQSGTAGDKDKRPRLQDRRR